MRVLLAIPTHLYRFEWPSFISLPDSPIGLAYIASAIRAAGHEVHAVNAVVPYRHFIPNRFEKRALSLAQNPLTRALVALGETRAMVFAVRMAARVMGVRYPSWKALLEVLPHDARPADVRAGCQQCNRQFKIRTL